MYCVNDKILDHVHAQITYCLKLPFWDGFLSLFDFRLPSSGSSVYDIRVLLLLLCLLGEASPFTTCSFFTFLLLFLLLLLGSYSGSLPSLSLSNISAKDRLFLAALGVLRRTRDDDVTASPFSCLGSVFGVVLPTQAHFA